MNEEAFVQLGTGTPTGFCDTEGNMIHIGDHVKKALTINQHIHGNWCIYKVVLKGIIPVLLYDSSEKGQVMQKGSVGAPLSTIYDLKDLLYMVDSKSIRPLEEMVVMAGVIYRCGWCGFPVGENGEQLSGVTDSDQANTYLEENKNALVENRDGFCCPNGNGEDT